MIRSGTFPLALALIAAACAPLPPPSPAQRAQRAQAAACRANADATFDKQNRYLLSEQDTTDAPFSSSGVSGITTRGLSQRYGYDQDLSNCLAATRGGNPNSPSTSVQPGPPTGTPVAPY